MRSTRDLGTHRLAGLPDPEHIHQLYADGLPRDFPPLRNTVAMLGNAMRVVIAEDSVLLREGVVRLLEESGFEVAAQSDNADDLLRHVAMHKPDVAIVDIRMPPTHTDEGLVAAQAIRERFPGTGVLVLSQYVEAGYASISSPREARASATCSRTGSSDLEEFAPQCVASARADRRSIRPSSASSSAAAASTTRSTSSPRGSAR